MLQNLAGCISELENAMRAAKLYKGSPLRALTQECQLGGLGYTEGIQKRHASDRSRLTCRTDVQTEQRADLPYGPYVSTARGQTQGKCTVKGQGEKPEG